MRVPSGHFVALGVAEGIVKCSGITRWRTQNARATPIKYKSHLEARVIYLRSRFSSAYTDITLFSLMKIDIHIPCYNEASLIEATVHHYRTRFPTATFYVYDNFSTDNSAEIAKRLGCRVTTWGNPVELDMNEMTMLVNNTWKSETTEWVIICDMDEWICITEEQLLAEAELGTTIIRTCGYNMVGRSERSDLTDISLHEIQHGVQTDWYSKRIIFNAKEIGELNSGSGQHWCHPSGNCVESKFRYVLKHMDFLGKAFKIKKNRQSFLRSERYRKMGHCGHHFASDTDIENIYNQMIADAVEVDFTPQK